ncbi:MAG TPA: hypothetical protein VE777_14250 [Gaiellales bacterium]|nr:hypothetical protein [Gaiellales bacterium]
MQVVPAEPLGFDRPAATAESSQTSDQLHQRDGLAHVVVGAEVQPENPISKRIGCREHEEFARRLLGAQPSTDLIAVDLGEVAIEDDHVVAAAGGHSKRPVAIVGEINRKAVAAQAASQRASQSDLVFD